MKLERQGLDAYCQSMARSGDCGARLVHLVNASGMSASFMDLGASWLSCRLPVASGPREVLLCAKDLESHINNGAYFGAVVGRYANRIANGRFNLGELSHQISCNDGDHALHGGIEGFDSRHWQIETEEPQAVTFALQSADGDQGFPGNLTARVRYSLTDASELVMDVEAKVDQSCPVSLSSHAYFNLTGEASRLDCLDHELQVFADQYLPTDSNLVPTGVLADVEGSGFDFRDAKTIRQDLMTDSDQQIACGYDHAMILQPERTDGKLKVAELTSPDGDVRMRLRTTLPALQMYTGNFLEGVVGRTGTYRKHQGIALETEYFPDGPNHLEWGSRGGLLEAGQVRQSKTVYEFEYV